MNVIELFFLSYLFFKPYYFLKSGGLQFADLFLILSFVFYLLYTKNNQKVVVDFLKDNKKIVIYIVFACCINFIYFLIFSMFKFVLSSMYYIYILMSIMIFRYLYISIDNFKEKIEKCIKINLVLQLLIYVLGVGKYYDLTRYMGTFNDPNQFGYYILLSLCFLTVLKNKIFIKNYFLYLLVGIFLIFCSGSTGMLLGIIILLFLSSFSIVGRVKQKIVRHKNKIFFLFVFFIIFILFFYLLTPKQTKIDIIHSVKNSTVLERLQEKTSRTSEIDSNGMSIWQERGYDKIFIYPYYCLFGAGEGYYERFVKAAHLSEIHATLPSILFYYGIIPFMFLISWLCSKYRRFNFKTRIPLLAMLVESFFLLNQRQTLFWIFFLLEDDNILKCNDERK